METWEIVLIVIVSFFSAFFVLFPLLDFLRSIRLSDSAEKSLGELTSDIGYVSWITGNVGAGKTTLGSALSNCLALYLSGKASKKIDDIKHIFSSVDFRIIDSICIRWFSFGYFKPSFVVKGIFYKVPEFSEIFSPSLFYDNYLSVRSNYDLLVDYVEALSALYRNTYIYFNQNGFYCRFTHSYAYHSDSSLIDIKDRFLSKDYSIFNYSVIFEDEKVLSDKKSTNFQKVSKDDKGGDMFLRLIRHFGCGNLYYITTSQRFTRAVLSERELATSIFSVFGHNEVIVDRFCLTIDDFMSSFFDWLPSFLSSFVDDSTADKIISSDWFIRKSQFFRNRHDYHYAKSFICYYGVLYTSVDDVGKKVEECSHTAKKFTYIFPICFAYGSSDTYGFNFIGRVLSEKTSSKFYPFNQSMSLSDLRSYASELLTKDSDKTAVDSVLFDSVKGVF